MCTEMRFDTCTGMCMDMCDATLLAGVRAHAHVCAHVHAHVCTQGDSPIAERLLRQAIQMLGDADGGHRASHQRPPEGVNSEHALYRSNLSLVLKVNTPSNIPSNLRSNLPSNIPSNIRSSLRSNPSIEHSIEHSIEPSIEPFHRTCIGVTCRWC